MSRRPPAVASECDRLIALVDAMPAVAERRRALVAGWYEQLFALAGRDERESASGERALDELAGQLRRAWMATAHEYADVTFRSPLAETAKRLPSHPVPSFGYERSWETNPLEARLDAYRPVPAGWLARHFLFSSGMAALSGIVQALPALLGERPLRRLVAASAYYETLDLLALGAHGATVDVVADEAAFARAFASHAPDVALLEPIIYDPWLRPFDVAGAMRALAAHAAPPAVVIDSTLVGPTLPMVRMLDDAASRVPFVIQASSGLKLDQAGLELANVGVVSLYAPAARAQALAAAADTLVRVRRLNGTAMTFDTVALLDVPFFLDPATFYEHSAAIFAHNARLARAIRTDGLVATVAHPSFDARALPWAQAPFVFLHLREDTVDAHVAFETLVLDLARRRGLALDRGGSFGFRGHRCEAIALAGAARRAVFKVALGVRAGPSLDGIVDLVREVSAFPTTDAARRGLAS